MKNTDLIAKLQEAETLDPGCEVVLWIEGSRRYAISTKVTNISKQKNGEIIIHATGKMEKKDDL